MPQSKLIWVLLDPKGNLVDMDNRRQGLIERAENSEISGYTPWKRLYQFGWRIRRGEVTWK